ncbi:acyl-CoA synthetase short-chain family member 3, mitochondrial isoform X2 [Zootermopsis nevadensis]|uniref:acyl-CoA synthetase short-chain family member 3, mitochondrial isoform X2 n=1 Tax=Zootermopsis nevadensis TaxID=136037 RepID=UPI000B8E8DEC|nr:acyl-CoA synthetase short-chain family member 3, mitochondrial isoform X2 [Zootermopsis nevadensis]
MLRHRTPYEAGFDNVDSVEPKRLKTEKNHIMLTPVNGDCIVPDLLAGKGKTNDVFKKQMRRPKFSLRDPAELEEFILKQTLDQNQKYQESFKRSLEEPEKFWAEVGQCVTWTKPWEKVLDNTNEPFTKWFVGGELNACYNAVDRHVLAGHGEKVALIHDSPVTKSVRHVTYLELQDKVSRLAGALAKMGVSRGDRVLVYMPMIPEAIIAMLATVRLGAIHSVVFGGFAAREVRARIEHAEPKVIIVASSGYEPNRIVRYKDIVNEAIATSSVKPLHCIIYQRYNIEVAELDPEYDMLWDDALVMSNPHPCVPVEANEPLYILYTSGTTDQPKGIQRPVGGHIATLAWTMHTIYGMGKNDVWWTASDMGWVVGHSYICYGPLTYGITSVMYEGKPDRTPDPGAYFRVIHEHGVNAMFTAPTALRVIKRVDPEVKFGSQYSNKSLRTLFVAGEHCDYDTTAWATKIFDVPVLNHWWQTETGHSITASCVGFGHPMNPPKYAAGLPFIGYDVHVLRPDGTEADQNEMGCIVCKLPLPPGTMSTLYNAPERFLQVYFSKFPGFYDTMDAGFIDEHGYVYVMARDDDVINVAGHRLSTAALEDVVLSHPDVVDATVVGVPEPTKGEIPLCLFIMKDGARKTEPNIIKELIKMVRELIGPIAAFHVAAAVTGLPRTRSGKTARKSIADLARNKLVKISGTIEDPTVYKEIKAVLQKLGYAKIAPDPQ